MAKTAKRSAEDEEPTKRTRNPLKRESARDDGRVPTTVYIRPELLDEVKAAAKKDYQPAFIWIERAIEGALKGKRGK